jgi:protein-disulfide isomerase
MSKRFFGVIIVIIIIFVGVFALGNQKNNSTSKPTEHIEGLGKDGVSLVEYGDYECPYCGQYYSIVKQVVQEYNNQITFQFRNFPLTSIHPHAYVGARAAEAAALQNKFWQMHDLLYEQNVIYTDSNETASTWINTSNPLTDFDQYAKQLGLNVSKFNQDYNSDQVNNSISADLNAGNALGIDATPTFYLDGKQISPGETVSAFQTLINQAIAQKSH